MTKDLEQATEEAENITVKTGRLQNDVIGTQEYVKIRGIVSVISFSRRIKDYKRKQHKGIILKTGWFRSRCAAYWEEWLEDEKGIFLAGGENFGELNEDFSSYTQERLETWQEEAIRHHEQALAKIKELYWQGGEIPSGFLGR